MGFQLASCRTKLVVILTALALSACAAPHGAAPVQGPDCTRFAVTSTGWHAGLYVPADAFDRGGRVRAQFPDARWFWIGWGEHRAYPGPLTARRAVTAAAWPTASLVHVSAHARDPRSVFAQDHVDVAVSQAVLERLATLIEAEITGPARQRGLTRDSAFFPASSSYHVFQTCNVWLAQTLEAAGLETGWTPGHWRPASLLRAVERRTPRACPQY